MTTNWSSYIQVHNHLLLKKNIGLALIDATFAEIGTRGRN